ncbi:hypothetical protein [Streptomyces sp. YIM S03343]
MKRFKQARISICLVFAALGVTNAAWSSRIPDIRRNVGADTTVWGLVGMSSAFGDLVAITVTLILIGRVRNRALTRSSVALMLVSGPLLAGASGLPVLICGLATWGPGVGRRGCGGPSAPAGKRTPAAGLG